MSWGMIGHRWAVESLQRQLASGGLRQAYLFTGPAGVGKRTLALRFAQAILCESVQWQPCLDCRSCRHLADRSLPDGEWLEAERIGGTLKIEQVRELQRRIALSPYQSAHRIAFVLRAHEMSEGASNALLKTLEEPPPQVILMLTARSAESLLPTIVSRCETVPLRLVPRSELMAGLRDRLGAEQAELVGSLAAGRPGVALQLAEDEAALADRQRSLEDLAAILGGSRIERFRLAANLIPGKDRSAERAQLSSTLGAWLSVWRDVMLRAYGLERPLANPDRRSEVEQMANSLQPAEAAGVVRSIQETLTAVDRNANLSLALEALLLKLPTAKGNGTARG